VPDRSCFAGSTTLLNQEIPILIQEVGLSIPDAIRMVTEIPAKIIRINQETGSIKAGLAADLVIFNDEFTPLHVFQNGISVYSMN